jgi:serine/threonine protein kinase
MMLSPWTLKTRSHSYTVDAVPFVQGATCDFYASVDSNPTVHPRDQRLSVLKIPRSPDSNDRVEHEAMVLRRLSAQGDKRFVSFVPDAHELCRHIIDGDELTCLVLEPLDGFYTLTEVIGAYPDGIGGRDIAWMWRRLLVAVGFAHEVGIVHTAISPDHIMIHPDEHGLVLVGWGTSTEMGDTWAADIEATSSAMLAALGAQAPPEMRAFAKGCQTSRRSAWALKEDYDELLERLYGRRRFHPFHMPTEPALNRKKD